jgi:hypothetical protein
MEMVVMAVRGIWSGGSARLDQLRDAGELVVADAIDIES